MDYDPAKGAEYATYIYPFIWDSMLRFRMGEAKWSVSSLTNYKMVRSMAWLYHKDVYKRQNHPLFRKNEPFYLVGKWLISITLRFNHT